MTNTVYKCTDASILWKNLTFMIAVAWYCVENPTNLWVTMSYRIACLESLESLISPQIWRRELCTLGLAHLLIACKTIACVMNSSSRWNGRLRGPRLDLIPSCFRLFKAWVTLRILGSTVIDSYSHTCTLSLISISLSVCLSLSLILARREGGSSVAIFPSSWDTVF